MSVVTINPDKTISIDGKKTFPIGMSHICAPYYPLTNCVQNTNVNSNALFSELTGDSSYRTNVVMPAYNSKNILFTEHAWTTTPDIIKNNSGLFAYLQWDEPTLGSGIYKDYTTEEQMLAHLLKSYNNKKTNDPAHPVIINHWTKMTKWLPYGDIMMWDTYTITHHSWQVGVWTREDAIYAWELASWNNYFQGTELNQISKPVWTYIQANIDDPSWSGYEPTPQEARANTYAAITLDVKGIEYFGYMVMGDWSHVETITGVYSNQTLAAYYNALMGEIQFLNDILVLPTLDYSWHYHPGTKVSFSKKYTKNVYWVDTTNFNYILKQDGKKYYLIILNKDRRSISDVTVTISGLSGIMTATTIGNIDAGSIPGRTLPVTDGQFTDSFDGLAVHIYEIGSDIPCPQSQCDFTITQ